MDWFERLTGFREAGYADVRSRLELEGSTLRSRENGRRCRIGHFELVSLQTLRDRVAAEPVPAGRLSIRNVQGDVRRMHGEPAYAGALFQVASQFNMLEMVSPNVTPEDGVTGYQFDRTQGPACAIAAGAATLYRNYFAPVDGGVGQTKQRQLDGLADIGAALSLALDRPAESLWSMCNGYALCTEDGLAAIGDYLRGLEPAALDALRARLRIGLHWGVEVTDAETAPGPIVSQAFCSALPVAYSGLPAPAWGPFAILVLNAAYEATLLAALLNARAGGSRTVLLTRLGGGAFGNDDLWIDAAMTRALTLAKGRGLDVELVSFGQPAPSMLALEALAD